MNSELFDLIFLNRVPYLTPRRLRALTEQVGSVQSICRLRSGDLQALGVPDAIANTWAQSFRDRHLAEKAKSEWERAARGEFRIVAESDSDYPALLRDLPGRPPVLFVKGKWPLSERLTLAVVGTRHPSPYGLSVTQQLVRGLAGPGTAIVSGMAMGVDRTAHQIALESGGQTVGVLGHGFGFAYPRENGELYRHMALNGTLMSEFPFETGPSRLNFPRRNRIISGLCRGVVVIEASERSGALITARYAAEQGRDVFAVPGSIYEEQAAGCHRLIQEGAKLVQQVSDILEDYRSETSLVGRPAEPSPPVPITETVSLNELNPLECAVLQKIVQGSISVDELADTLQEPIDLLMNALLSLELKGRIRLLSGQRYAYNH